MYENVTSYLGKLKPAHWKYPENQGDGSDEHPFIAGWPEYDETTKEFMKMMKELVPNGGKKYTEIIYQATGFDGQDDLTCVDVSKLDGTIIIYMIFSKVRGERFSNGIFGRYVADGTMDKWLARLKELDEAK